MGLKCSEPGEQQYQFAHVPGLETGAAGGAERRSHVQLFHFTSWASRRRTSSGIRGRGSGSPCEACLSLSSFHPRLGSRTRGWKSQEQRQARTCSH